MSNPHANAAPANLHHAAKIPETALGCPRDFLDNRFVYIVISPRARGLSVGVNLNPDKFCDFDCIYCEVDRRLPELKRRLNLKVMASELERTVEFVQSGSLAKHPRYAGLSPELLELRHVTLSGDGEPTLSPQFVDAVQTIAHVRAKQRLPFFKMVLITNASHLDELEVRKGLQLFTKIDEVWAKFEAGTEDYMKRVNVAKTSIERVQESILSLACERPVIIQSLFPMIEGREPDDAEIEAYAMRLKSLKDAGAMIPLVQIYSATRPIVNRECSHLPLRALKRIAQKVREISGLEAEVF